MVMGEEFVCIDTTAWRKEKREAKGSERDPRASRTIHGQLVDAFVGWSAGDPAKAKPGRMDTQIGVAWSMHWTERRCCTCVFCDFLFMGCLWTCGMLALPLFRQYVACIPRGHVTDRDLHTIE